MWSFLCSDGRSNKTLSAGSPTVEIKFTTAPRVKKCINGSSVGKLVQDNVLESNFPPA
jgi:hypothetical protein